jgi:hypothetical protein
VCVHYLRKAMRYVSLNPSYSTALSTYHQKIVFIVINIHGFKLTLQYDNAMQSRERVFCIFRLITFVVGIKLPSHNSPICLDLIKHQNVKLINAL